MRPGSKGEDKLSTQVVVNTSPARIEPSVRCEYPDFSPRPNHGRDCARVTSPLISFRRNKMEKHPRLRKIQHPRFGKDEMGMTNSSKFYIQTRLYSVLTQALLPQGYSAPNVPLSNGQSGLTSPRFLQRCRYSSHAQTSIDLKHTKLEQRTI